MNNASSKEEASQRSSTKKHPSTQVSKALDDQIPSSSTNEPASITSEEVFFYKNWARFADIMQIQNGQDSQEWGNHLLQHLVPFVQGFQAVLYMKSIEETEENQESFHLIGGYAVDVHQLQQVIYSGEDTIGQVAKNRQKRYIIHPNLSDHFKSVTSTRQLPVHSILTLPVIYQQSVYGILEILFYQPIEQKYLHFLEQITSSVGANLCLLLKDEKIRLQNEHLNHQLRQTRNHLLISEEFRKLHSSLTESVMYARNIQAAILPSESSFTKLFQDFFIIYQPKDIVSGDFYWLAQIINRSQDRTSTRKIIFIAAVDCTGHGVPGAFMSMIGNSLLNEIISKKGVNDPARILKLLHIGIRSSLKQSQGQNKDGMDICLCKIIKSSPDQYEITFAGAKRPLYYSKNKQLFKSKGTRRSLGGGHQVKGLAFTNEVIKLTTHDKLFLSTDGFKDVASPKRRNLGLRKFEALLEQGIPLPMAKHRTFLLDSLQTHQQHTQQRDDITLIGIQL